MTSQSSALKSDLSVRLVAPGALIGSNKAAKNPYILVKFGLVAAESPVTAAATEAAAAVAALAADPAFGAASEKFSTVL